jgi:C_GCAxxG_C_C family probable redox protein
MDHQQKALDLFDKQFNCAQSTFAALAEEAGIDVKTALKCAACFGGGMRCGEACGAVTGALMALGYRFGSAKEKYPEGKAAAYQLSVRFLDRFREERGTILCRELLGFTPGVPEDAEQIKALGLHGKICIGVILDAVEIAQDIIRQG